MENASKALIIAGAILISILLIAISMYVYTSAQGTVTQAGAQMSAQEKDMYNAKINSYVGDSKAGIDVKNLIDAVISNNNANMEDTGKFIAIEVGNNINIPNTTTIAIDTGDANTQKIDNSSKGFIGIPGDSDNKAGTVNTKSKEMQKLKSCINTGKRYNISTKTSSTGLIIQVLINEM